MKQLIKERLSILIKEELNRKNTQVISAFPGCGKSFIFKNNKDKNKVILDSDSSEFSWIKKGERNPDFPNNYIEHIKENIGKADIIFVSSHKDVRNSLVDNNIKFTLVYPDESLKDEYIERYIQRNNEDSFIELLKKMWETWMEELKGQTGCKKIILKSGQFLKDVINI